MEGKTQYEALMEELQKIANNITDAFTELGDTLAKILPDVEIPDEEEDTWKMKCPYKVGDKHYCIQPSGEVFMDCWYDTESDNSYFSQGNTFPTIQAALLEVKRRDLLTRFRTFRDECNGDWKPDWKNENSCKYCLLFEIDKFIAVHFYLDNNFSQFGYFKNKDDAIKAIKLFGDEIKALFVDCEVQ